MSEEMNLRTCSEADAKAVTNDALNRDALDYHRFPTPSKISVLPTKDMTTQRDLALAFRPAARQSAWPTSTNPWHRSHAFSSPPSYAGPTVTFENPATLPGRSRCEREALAKSEQ